MRTVANTDVLSAGDQAILRNIAKAVKDLSPNAAVVLCRWNEPVARGSPFYREVMQHAIQLGSLRNLAI